MYIPKNRWEWFFILIALLQALICLALEAYVFGEFETSVDWDKLQSDQSNQQYRLARAKAIPTYLAIFIFGFVYQIVLVWDALRLSNTIQVIGICLYNLGMMIYAAVQQDQVTDTVDAIGADYLDLEAWEYVTPCLTAVPCILGGGTLLLSGVAWKLYSVFAWSIYKQISADLRLKRRYLIYQVNYSPATLIVPV